MGRGRACEEGRAGLVKDALLLICGEGCSGAGGLPAGTDASDW